MVGAAGFEPTTTSPPDWCATRLRHAPTDRSLAPGPRRPRQNPAAPRPREDVQTRRCPPASVLVMRYEAAPRSNDRTVPDGSDDGFVDAGAPDEWRLEELIAARETLGSRWSNRWLGAMIAVAVGIVAYGFVGQLTDTPPRPATAVSGCPPVAANVMAQAIESEPAAFVLTTPADGTEVRAGVIDVRGIAGRGLGTLHIAVVMGDAVLGWTNLDVRAAGPVSTSIRVFAPSFDAPVVLRIDSRASSHGPGFSSATALRLHAPAGVNVWRITRVGSLTTRAIRVEGFGPATVKDVEVGLTTSDGRVIASATAPIGYDDGRPGSVGGESIGLGSFAVRLDIHGPLPTGPVVLRLRWHVGAGGDLREIREIVHF
jgi:hypothetical protein